MRYFNRLIILCFVLFISIPSITHVLDIFDVKYIESIENRKANPMPPVPKTLKDLNLFPDRMTQYFNDYFGFRAWLIKSNNTVKQLLGLSSSPRVLIGKNGWLYLTDEDMIPQYCGSMTFSSSDKASWIKTMEERGAWLKSKGIPLYLVIAPNKMTIYPEYLPDGINKLSVKTSLEQLEHMVHPPENFTFMSLKPELLKAKMKFHPYYKTDSHWNFHGAFTGYQAIMNRIIQNFPTLEPVTGNDIHFDYYTGFGQDLSRVLNLADRYPDPFADRYKLKKKSAMKRIKQLDKENPFPKIVHTGLTGKPKALIFRDSYTNAMEYLFNETFQTIIYASYDWMKFDKTLVEKYDPDLVLHVMVERMLRYKPDNDCLHQATPELVIKNWGPQNVKSGAGFNIQPNGQSALWIISEHVNEHTVIFWEDQPLKTEVNTKTSVLTALVPDDCYNAQGKYSISIKDTKNNKVSNPVYFTVSK